MDWLLGLKHWRFWGALAYQDIRNRYRRSLMGPLWITITMGITILAMGPLFGDLFGGQDPNFIPRMGFGLIIWSLVSSMINDYVDCFVSAAHYIKNIKLPYSVYIYRIAFRQIILFAHNALLFIPLYLIYPGLLTGSFWLACFMLLLAIFWLMQIGALIAILCTRYRDVGPLVNNITQLLFFITPIVWPISQLGDTRKLIVEINPIFYLLEAIRMPLMGLNFKPSIFSIIALLVLIASIFAHYMLKKKIDRLAYWL